MTLDIVQTVAYMALAAGGASDIPDTAANLTRDLDVYLTGGTAPDGSQYTGFFPLTKGQLSGGDWTVVWGPVVVVPSGPTQNFASNSMYVAYSASPPTYVVAIAGTDFDSLYDWFEEDANVSLPDMVSWPPGSSGNEAMISGATNTGIANLQAMTDSNGVSLSQFLSGTVNANATLIFTGHSLGGALSPTLALALYPDPTSSGWKEVYVLPLAGPTPGNQAFADIFDAAYPTTSSGSTTYGAWNADYQNWRDMVPRAWNRLQSIQPLPKGNIQYGTIWGWPTFGMRLKIQYLIENAQNLLQGAKYWRVNYEMFGSEATWGYFLPGPTFPSSDGTWEPVWHSWPTYGIIDPIGSDTLLEELISSSHLDQYYRFFRLVPIQPLPLSSAQIAAKRTAELKRRMALAAARISADAEVPEADARPAEEVDADYDEAAPS